LKLKDYSRSQAVTYTVKISVISEMMEDSDVATTDNCNRKLYMTYRIGQF